MNFLDVVSTLNQVGFYDVVVPWLLFFGIVFGLLQNKQIITDERGINALIATAIAFFIVAFTPAGTTIANFFSTLFGGAGMIIGALLVLMLFAAIMGEQDAFKEGGNGQPPIKYAVVFVLLIFAYLVYANAFGGATSAMISNDTLVTLLTLVFILGVIWIAMQGGGGGGEGGED